jgi:hypothetical protein
MARLRINNVGDAGGTTNPITISSSSSTTCSWSTAPANLPTVASPDYVVLVVEANTSNEEIIYLTAFTSGGTSGTISRGEEGSAAIAHSSTTWISGPTALDFEDIGVYVDDLGGDPTGTNDSTSAFNNALSSLPTVGGVATGRIVFGQGTYKLGSSADTNNIGPLVTVVGAAKGATILDYHGSNQCLRAFNPNTTTPLKTPTTSSVVPLGGGVYGLTIEMSNAGSGASGLHIGDIEGFSFDIVVNNSTSGTPTSTAVHMDNTITWTEKTYGRLFSHNNKYAALIEQTGSTGSVSNSFGYNDLFIQALIPDTCFGAVIRAGGLFYNGRLQMRGNANGGTGGGDVLFVGGKNGLNQYSQLSDSELDVAVEANGTGTYPRTINISSAGNNLMVRNWGRLSFGANNTFLGAQAGGSAPTTSSFTFCGLVYGDSGLTTGGAATFLNLGV